MSESYKANRYDIFFEMNSMPLKVVYQPIVGCKYCTIDGTIIRLVSAPPVDDVFEYYMIQRSELTVGNSVTELKDKSLSLFWTLVKNNYSKIAPYEDNTD